jgi:DNA polymerase III subunit delta'
MFCRLIGNERIKALLKDLVRNNRVPGSLLFVGENGIGKKRFALELAKTLNCQDQSKMEACDECSSCKRINQFTYPAEDDTEANKQIIWTGHSDVGLIRASGRYITVPQMRELEREAHFRPFEGNARIFLIEDADRLNEASSNALLKTLEEPPLTTYIVLLTSRPSTLLSTIRSRCQTFRFVPVKVDEIKSFLTERKQHSIKDIELLSHLSQGSLGKALSIDIEKYRDERNKMLEITEALILTKDSSKLLRIAEDLTDPKQKEEYEDRIGILESLLRDLWVVKLGRSDDVINQDIAERLSQISKKIESHEISTWLSSIEKLRQNLAVNINRKVATDSLFLSMVQKK